VFLESPQHKFKPVLWPLRRATICQVSRLRCTDQTFGSKKVVFCGLSYRPKLFLSVWVCSWNLPSTNLSLFCGHWRRATICQVSRLRCTDQTFGSKKVVFCGLSYRPKLFLSVWVCSWNLPSTNLSLFCGHWRRATICKFPAFVARSDLWIKESGILRAVVSTQTVPECLGVFLESPQHNLSLFCGHWRRATICQVSRLRCTDQTFGSKKVVFCRLSYRPKLFLSVWVCSWNLPSTNLSLFCGHWRRQLSAKFPAFVARIRPLDQKKVVFCGLSYRPKTVPECLGVFLESPQHKLSLFVAIGDGQLSAKFPAFVARIRPLDQRKWYFAGCRSRPKMFLMFGCVPGISPAQI